MSSSAPVEFMGLALKVRDWEQPSAPASRFAAAVGGAALAGLLAGASINAASVQLVPTTSTRRQCAAVLLLQVALNLALMYVLLHRVAGFLPWLQLTLSGFVFNLLLFTSQPRLSEAAQCALTSARRKADAAARAHGEAVVAEPTLQRDM